MKKYLVISALMGMTSMNGFADSTRTLFNQGWSFVETDVKDVKTLMHLTSRGRLLTSHMTGTSIMHHHLTVLLVMKAATILVVRDGTRRLS